MRQVKYKGKWLPLISTPISKNELFNLQQDHRSFLIHDRDTGKINFMDSNSKNYNLSFDMGFQSLVRVTGIVFGIYYFFTIKRKISKINPFSKASKQETQEFINKLNTINMKGKIQDDKKSTSRSYDIN
jgi:hypothetical protein